MTTSDQYLLIKLYQDRQEFQLKYHFYEQTLEINFKEIHHYQHFGDAFHISDWRRLKPLPNTAIDQDPKTLDLPLSKITDTRPHL